MKNSLTKRFVLVLGLAGAMVACAPQKQQAVSLNTDNSIIGGVPVEATDLIAKTTVALVGSIVDAEGKEGQFVCTGTLIKDNVVLTAGHCIPEAKEGEKTALYVIFNTNLNKITRQDIRLVDKTVRHPKYDQADEKGFDMNDMALVRYVGPKAAGYQVASFLKDDSALKEGTSVVLAGYGLTDGVNKTGDNLLRKVDVEVIQQVGKTEIALDQSKGKGACHGDSGGPAFLVQDGVPYVWGVTSRGIGKNGVDDCSLFSLYTSKNAQQAFVDDALAQLAK